jgi:hypothetical protein
MHGRMFLKFLWKVLSKVVDHQEERVLSSGPSYKFCLTCRIRKYYICMCMVPAMQQSSCYEAAEELLKLQLAEQLN